MAKSPSKSGKPAKGLSSLSSGREKPKMIPSVTAVNPDQKNVLRAIADIENHIVFIDGVAGVGKTHLSVSWGLEQLLKGRYERMIFTRPYVEAGESLGYLPGSFDSKIAPFMIPIFDILHDNLTAQEVKEMVENRQIITLPLAYMRGVTFKNGFVLLDEAQNSTIRQMHLFLTRIGQGSKVVVTGDREQSDIGQNNGFGDAFDRISDIKGIELITMDPTLVVRHPIIPELERRYTKKG
jgi:phosphate starvation-inducible PhoH-like protein